MTIHETASAKFAKDFKEFFIVGLPINWVDIDKADKAFGVDDNEGPLRGAVVLVVGVLAQNAKGLADLSMWEKIREQRIVDTANRFGPGFMTGNGINADTQNLGIELLETGQVVLVRGHLRPSNRGPIQRVEGDKDVLATQTG